MPNTQQGSIHLFRLAGIDVFLHWSWFIAAAYFIESRRDDYSSIFWNVMAFLALFVIVLTHEFGHALACRQVGGTANRIMLWPLGGVAYVDPPQRPGATLWSIAAGPLVNVALFLPLRGAVLMSRSYGWPQSMHDLSMFVYSVFWINAGLLIFNIMPFYPLDGGQILRSLLWFPLGRARSLMVATVLGIVGVVGFIGLAVVQHSLWTGAIALFMLLNCWSGLRQAKILLRVEKIPRRDGFRCPNCHTKPPLGERWRCDLCGQPFDTFQTGAICPNCSKHFPQTMCGDCGKFFPMNEWVDGSAAEMPVINGDLQAK
jgi:Zn-dependent protease